MTTMPDDPVHTQDAPETAVADPDRAAYIAGLRSLAAWLETHPDVPVLSHDELLYPISAFVEGYDEQLAELARVTAAVGDDALVRPNAGSHPAVAVACGPVWMRWYVVPPKAELAPCGPANPRPDSTAVFPITPRRLRLLADVRAGLVYAEAGKAYHDNGQVVTAQIVQALVARWVREGTLALGRTNRRVYELTPAGAALLSPGGAS